MPSAGSGAFDIIEDSKYRRDSLDRAFLPASLTHQRRSHLKICTNALVTKIALSSETEDRLRATGVFFEASVPRKAGIHYFAKARREVILCAGALGSPHLLMLRYVHRTWSVTAVFTQRTVELDQKNTFATKVCVLCITYRRLGIIWYRVLSNESSYRR